MKDDNVIALEKPEGAEDPLTAMLRAGAKELIKNAVEAEVKCIRFLPIL